MWKWLTFIVLIIAALSGLLIWVGVDDEAEPITTPVIVPDDQEVTTLASGCFWCLEAVLQETEGVSNVLNGYAGGQEPNPTYEEVYTQQTTHREAVQVFYDPDVISYEEILDIYWHNINPSDAGGQFTDRGFSYTTAIFYHDDIQKEVAEASKATLPLKNNKINFVATEVLPFTTFYRAEEFHQDYYQKSADRYKTYSENSGREEFKAAVWQAILDEQ